MPVDWAAIRSEFPALQNWTFLNTATFGQLPRRATEAVNRHFFHRDKMACWDFLDWFDDADRIRESVARLIHCEAGDIAFIQNAASALSLLIDGIEWKEGDRIVTLRDEFPNNLYHPSVLETKGVQCVEVDWSEFYQAIDERTRLVAMSTVNYTSGLRPAAEEVSRYLRERGVVLYLDGTQSVGALEFDTARIRPDVLAVHGYKWLLSPNGAGFMYVAPELRERLQPSVIGWRSHKDWRNVDNLHHGAPEFKHEAEKYEGGMLPFPLLYAMEASVQMMLEIGPAEIENRVLGLTAQLRDSLRAMGASVLDGRDYCSPITAARFDNVDASRLARELKQRRVLVSARHGNVRISVHFYNNEADLERFSRELQALL
ncbi:MAG TPA: aminotransferase class V-fold PLP-dependent enzyme [Bryobacteraceae bacterium]|nr:aminotransferase class V-fold PLP-dependent enzyme [Bryobacteraceae bacterium]